MIRFRSALARRGSRGQTMVEFALVFPLILLLIVGMITGAFLYFQNQALVNATRAASRWATIETAPSVGTCETGTPKDAGGNNQTAVTRARDAANLVPVNPAPLCPAAGSTTEMTQGTYVLNKANIVLDAYPSLAVPECITVTVTYEPPKVPGPWGTIVMRSQSSSPTFAAKSTTTCPLPTFADGTTTAVVTGTTTFTVVSTSTGVTTTNGTTTTKTVVTTSTATSVVSSVTTIKTTLSTASTSTTSGIPDPCEINPDQCKPGGG